MEKIRNQVELCGVLSGKPEFSHIGRNEAYYSFPLCVERLSGVEDTINVIVRKKLLETTEIAESRRISVLGELRSYNNRSGIGNKLVITVFAHSIEFTDEEDKNIVRLSGTICKQPNLRRTPMGREICDLMIAVNRRYGRSDYLPCIAWGRIAKEAGDMSVGTDLDILGRIQSRNYIKTDGEEIIEKTAFEVSVIELAEVDDLK